MLDIFLYLWSKAALLSWKSWTTHFTAWTSFARRASIAVISLLSLDTNYSQSTYWIFISLNGLRGCKIIFLSPPLVSPACLYCHPFQVLHPFQARLPVPPGQPHPWDQLDQLHPEKKQEPDQKTVDLDSLSLFFSLKVARTAFTPN